MKRFSLILLAALLVASALSFGAGAVANPFADSNVNNSGGQGTGSLDPAPYTNNPYYMYYGTTDSATWSGFLDQYPDLRTPAGIGVGVMGTTAAGRNTNINPARFASTGQFTRFRSNAYCFLMSTYDAAYSEYLPSTLYTVKPLQIQVWDIYWFEDEEREDAYMGFAFHLYDPATDTYVQDDEEGHVLAALSSAYGYRGCKWYHNTGDPVGDLYYSEDDQSWFLETLFTPQPYIMGYMACMWSATDYGQPYPTYQVRKLQTLWRLFWSYSNPESTQNDLPQFYAGLNGFQQCVALIPQHFVKFTGVCLAFGILVGLGKFLIGRFKRHE